eukprot:TRINITY_DN62361_c0_g1_i1.p1 TRINITY_DN62361_c0_g1~~TRINITY_DN62361_c0_g1_i1.p1  ORF type:complete len:214 (+),score=41.74 TRINITY_DN62361_c0_g1_i1:63-704(+)
MVFMFCDAKGVYHHRSESTAKHPVLPPLPPPRKVECCQAVKRRRVSVEDLQEDFVRLALSGECETVDLQSLQAAAPSESVVPGNKEAGHLEPQQLLPHRPRALPRPVRPQASQLQALNTTEAHCKRHRELAEDDSSDTLTWTALVVSGTQHCQDEPCTSVWLSTFGELRVREKSGDLHSASASTDGNQGCGTRLSDPTLQQHCQAPFVPAASV